MNGWKVRLGKKSKVSGNKYKWTHNNPKPMGHSKGSPEREGHSDTGLSKKDKHFNPNPTHTRTRGTTTKAAQSK